VLSLRMKRYEAASPCSYPRRPIGIENERTRRDKAVRYRTFSNWSELYSCQFNLLSSHLGCSRGQSLPLTFWKSGKTDKNSSRSSGAETFQIRAFRVGRPVARGPTSEYIRGVPQ
jgi:hypothetical protein